MPTLTLWILKLTIKYHCNVGRIQWSYHPIWPRAGTWTRLRWCLGKHFYELYLSRVFLPFLFLRRYLLPWNRSSLSIQINCSGLSITLTRKVLWVRISEVSTLSAVTRPVKNVVLPANCANPPALLELLPSRLNPDPIMPVEPPGTILTWLNVSIAAFVKKLALWMPLWR